MSTNYCVSCGQEIPEGLQVCINCLSTPPIIGVDLAAKENITGTFIVSPMPPFIMQIEDLCFKADNAEVLLEYLARYYQYHSILTTNGCLPYSFVESRSNPNETLSQTADRLMYELSNIKKVIDSLLLKNN